LFGRGLGQSGIEFEFRRGGHGLGREDPTEEHDARAISLNFIITPKGTHTISCGFVVSFPEMSAVFLVLVADIFQEVASREGP
jgi:hypothetical protein